MKRAADHARDEIVRLVRCKKDRIHIASYSASVLVGAVRHLDSLAGNYHANDPMSRWGHMLLGLPRKQHIFPSCEALSHPARRIVECLNRLSRLLADVWVANAFSGASDYPATIGAFTADSYVAAAFDLAESRYRVLLAHADPVAIEARMLGTLPTAPMIDALSYDLELVVFELRSLPPFDQGAAQVQLLKELQRVAGAPHVQAPLSGPAHFTREETQVLSKLFAMHPTLATLDDLERQLSRSTAGKVVNTLIEKRYAHRPSGPRKGVGLTEKGIAAAQLIN